MLPLTPECKAGAIAGLNVMLLSHFISNILIQTFFRLPAPDGVKCDIITVETLIRAAPGTENSSNKRDRAASLYTSVETQPSKIARTDSKSTAGTGGRLEPWYRQRTPNWLALAFAVRLLYKKKLVTASDIDKLNLIIHTSKDVHNPALEKLINEMRSTKDDWNLETSKSP